MITLDEAIEHAEEMAKIHCVLKNKYNQKCAEEHRQLAEWLKDYKRLLAIESGIDDDLIRRQDALDMVRILQTYKLFEGDDMILVDKADVQTELMMLPSAEPERLTDDDFETIRIHLNALKERLCNQRRWKEAEDYERLINRFISFASAQPEIIRCKDCKYWTHIKRTNRYWCKTDDGLFDLNPSPDDFCSRAERRIDECTN